MRAAAIIAAALVLAIINLVGWGAVVAAVEQSERATHVEHHIAGERRPCGCAASVEMMRAELLATLDVVSQRIDAVESRCVWLGPHRVPVMRVGRWAKAR